MSIDIEQIRARAEAATPGPWHRDRTTYGPAYVVSVRAPAVTVTEGLLKRDAEFIAHARVDVPALLDEVERLREMLKAVKPRDDYLITRADKAEAERDRLRAAVDAVWALANNPIPQTRMVLADRVLAALNEHLGEG